MTLAKSTRKTTAKSAVKTAKKASVKKPAVKKSEKIDFDTFTVSQAELATLLGLATANITPMVQQGTMAKDADGRFNLRDSVSGYVKRMRERKSGDSKSELELEQIALKNEKLKEQLRSWRMQRDREVGLAIITALRNAMDKLKQECKMVPPICEAIDGLIDALARIDIENISYEIEGEAGDDEE